MHEDYGAASEAGGIEGEGAEGAQRAQGTEEFAQGAVEAMGEVGLRYPLTTSTHLIWGVEVSVEIRNPSTSVLQSSSSSDHHLLSLPDRERAQPRFFSNPSNSAEHAAQGSADLNQMPFMGQSQV